MKKVIAFVLSTICVFSLVGCGIKTSKNTDTKKYYIPVIVLNGQVYVARGDIVSELPDGYSYAGELTEEEKQYAYIDGSKYYIKDGAETINEIYVYQECGTPTSPGYVDNFKRQWAYAKWEKE